MNQLETQDYNCAHAQNVEQTKLSLLREASRTLNTISKVKNDQSEFVKCKHAYDHPEDLRLLYLEALDALIEDGVMELVITNEYLDLFEIKQPSKTTTVESAKEALLKQLRQDGRIYKIHSPRGEFVQCKKFALGGNPLPDDNEEESRILFLQALSELMRYGKIDLVAESKEMCIFSLAHQYSSESAA
jgi:hypothetical protein